ncbi:uncharacterized protein CIMG_07607 [Coccidioides immitis RS]|uniref:F-box domain-containing protein n=3 Tax=Coccidioides immitis TaxID=5501 RepID=J3K3R6_COCIM|nr:uncharacterized protein CIMG_07607 [Coccidioides immitis RS]EAS28861.3 hypothetical protein CIMG_07607 [Coccidioides immitis RS]KMP05978.1 hypothetical protein CIRG_05659 [Coccidioides immitis RMSCC 2394]KMU89805.1 hypothetical protein CIHG_07838 [Coccidioides immitis H538.4]
MVNLFVRNRGRQYLCCTAREQDFQLVTTGPHGSLHTSWGGRLEGLIFNDSACWVVFLFARPIAPSQLPESSHGPFARFHTLPIEIHYTILGFLDVHDILRFGLTCRHFWGISKSIITKYFAKLLGVWAGASVTCVGGDDRLLLDDSEHNKLRIFNEEWDETILIKRSNPMNSRTPEWNFSFPDVLSRHVFGLKCRFPQDLPEVINPRPASFYPTDKPWVLRNLTTREFVSAQAIALKPEYVRGPFIDILGFGSVIIARTFRTTHYTLPTVCDDLERGTRCRGAWVGHMLEIVPLDSIHMDGSWKDVSNEVAKELAEICEAKFGEDWRNKLISHKF